MGRYTEISFPGFGIEPFDLNGVALSFEIGGKPFTIMWYGIIICCAILTAFGYLTYRSKQQKLVFDDILDITLVTVCIAVLGARLYYVVFDGLSEYIVTDYGFFKNLGKSLYNIIAIWEGGLAIYGGVLGGLITAILFCRHHKFPLFRFLDLVVPSLVIGQAIGRWGNFVNQEAFGNLVADPSLQFFPYAVYIDALGEWHQATFFYESMWNICLLVAMLIVSRKEPKTGTLTCMYFVFYGLGRFLIEGLRTDSLYIIPGIRVSQVLSLFLICGGILLYVFFVRRNKTKNMYSGRYIC